MTRLSMTSFFAAAMLVAATGCKEDLTPYTKAWGDLEKQWNGSIDGANGKAKELHGKLDAMPATVAGRDKLEGAVKAADASAAAAKDQLGKGKAAFDAAVKAGKGAGVKAATDKAKTDMTAALAKADGDIAAAGKMLDEAKAQADAAAAALAQKLEPMMKAAKEGGKFDVSEIQFKENSADFAENPETMAALDRLVEFSKACDGLKYDLVGHTSKAGNEKANVKLSEEQATAVKTYLTSKGVDAAKIAKVVGKGGAEPAVDEPKPGSKEEKKMDPAALADARAKNHRISVVVTAACK